jgi:hypothetical protein
MDADMGSMTQQKATHSLNKHNVNYGVCINYSLLLPQDTHLFRNTIEMHLSETQAQQRTWITHNKKLVLHSAKISKAQTLLRIQRIKKFFPPQRVIASSITNPRGPSVVRYHITRLAQHYATKTVSRSTVRNRHAKDKIKQYNTPSLSTLFCPGTSAVSHLPTIDESTQSTSNAPQRRQLQRRLLNRDVFPDHPS